jgi:hypothetical protein
MVERLNSRIQELLQQTRFASVKELEATLIRYLAAYNHHIPQRALAHCTPVQAIEEWKLKNPGSIRFLPVYDLAGLDNQYVHVCHRPVLWMRGRRVSAASGHCSDLQQTDGHGTPKAVLRAWMPTEEAGRAALSETTPNSDSIGENTIYKRTTDSQ